MSRYVTVGFDRDADAELFKTLITEAGRKIKIFRTVVTDGVSKNTVTTIGVRSVFDNDPLKHNKRNQDAAGYIIEFKDRQIGDRYAHAITCLLTGQARNSGGDHLLDVIEECLKPENVIGFRYERE